MTKSFSGGPNVQNIPRDPRSDALFTKPVEEQTLVERLRVRACIRRSVRAKGDRIARDLDEAADRIEELERILATRQAKDW